jgi:hypothetical protein
MWCNMYLQIRVVHSSSTIQSGMIKAMQITNSIIKLFRLSTSLKNDLQVQLEVDVISRMLLISFSKLQFTM